MRFNSVFVLSAASAALGGVILRDVEYVWDVTQWQAGLSHGNPASPTTSFYVSGPAYGSADTETYVPPFAARCTGSGAGSPLSSEYSPCTIDSEEGAVSAKIVPDEDSSQAHIAISYAFENAGDARNFTALAVTDWARERPPYNFTLVPAEVL